MGGDIKHRHGLPCRLCASHHRPQQRLDVLQQQLVAPAAAGPQLFVGDQAPHGSVCRSAELHRHRCEQQRCLGHGERRRHLPERRHGHADGHGGRWLPLRAVAGRQHAEPAHRHGDGQRHLHGHLCLRRLVCGDELPVDGRLRGRHRRLLEHHRQQQRRLRLGGPRRLRQQQFELQRGVLLIREWCGSPDSRQLAGEPRDSGSRHGQLRPLVGCQRFEQRLPRGALRSVCGHGEDCGGLHRDDGSL